MIEKTYVNQLIELINDLLKKYYKLENISFTVDKNKDISNGDFFSNVAMVITKLLKRNPMQIVNEMKELFWHAKQDLVENVQVANPGYLNFDVASKYKKEFIELTLDAKENIGQFKKKDLFYNIEFVSANPTGLLHIGHARNAAYGQTLANIWKKYGIKVEKEYYINDAGNQINVLGISTFIRYLQLFDINVELPQDSYHGSEIIEVAKKIKEQYGNKFINEKIVDNKISNESVNDFFKNKALETMLTYIKQDLSNLRVSFDIFYSERDIYKHGLIENVLKKLEKYTFVNEGALWLKTTDFNDDKDRVLIKSDRSFTYFLPDIAYHNIKLTRHKDISKIFNVWGADHKSYVDRMAVAIECLGYKKDIIYTVIMQMVRLTKDGKEFKMSKRTGNSLTLRDLVNAIGVDSARWALVSQTPSTQIEIDIDKFISKTHDNNLYYVLYAYARICQLFNKIEFNYNQDIKFNLDLLTLSKEKELLNFVIYFPCIIETVANSYEINKINNYLYQLSQVFHSYYNEVKIKDEVNLELKNTRCVLLNVIMYIIRSGLSLMDITPQDKI